jgi:tRNA(fMet)-specific endonuclease VapC
MSYALDTNIVGAALNRHAGARRLIKQHLLQGLWLSSVVVFELRYGIAKSNSAARNTASLAAFLSQGVAVRAFDEADAEAAGALRATLEQRGTPIGPYDVLIAAQALRVGAIMVTANLKEFTRVDGLVCEDWTA